MIRGRARYRALLSSWRNPDLGFLVMDPTEPDFQLGVQRLQFVSFLLVIQINP